MSDEIETEVEFEDTYEPVPATLHDGGVIIFDPIEFQDTFNCHAAMFDQGMLYVLCRDTKQWHNVEPDKKVSKLKTVQ